MDRKEIYKKTEEISKGNLFSMFLTSLVYSLIISFIGFLLDRALPTETYANGIETFVNAPSSLFDGTSYLEFAFGAPLSYGLIKIILLDTLTIMTLMAMNMAVLDLVKMFYLGQEPSFNMSMFIENLRKYFKEILLVSLLFSIISAILTLIPYVGFILQIIVKIILFFIAFIIKEEKFSNPLSLTREVFKRTKGYKMDLFSLMVKYLIPPFMVLLVIFLLGLTNIEGAVIFAFLLVLIGFVIRALLFTNVAFAVAYEELLAYDDFKKNLCIRKYDQEDLKNAPNKSYEEKSKIDDQVIDDKDLGNSKIED